MDSGEETSGAGKKPEENSESDKQASKVSHSHWYLKQDIEEEYTILGRMDHIQL